MVCELRVVPRDCAAADGSAAVTSTHLHVGSVRQGTGGVAELAATVVVPADAVGAFWPHADVGAVRPKP